MREFASTKFEQSQPSDGEGLAPFLPESTEFGEPWSLDVVTPGLESAVVMDASGYTMVDLAGSEISMEDEAAFARRIVACVNAFRGVPTEQIELLGQKAPLVRKDGEAQ